MGTRNYSGVLGCPVVAIWRSCPVFKNWTTSGRICLCYVLGWFSMSFGSWELIFKPAGDFRILFSKIIFLWSRVPRKVPGKFLRSADILENEQKPQKPKMFTKFQHFLKWSRKKSISKSNFQKRFGLSSE